MILTTAQLKDILKAGGSLIVDASKMTPNQIVEMASAAATNRAARLTLKNAASVIPQHLITLSSLAPGQIVFDLES
jgi:hypothetical protein